jgi:hypothetical protein
MYEAVYNFHLSAEQLAALRKRFGIAVELAASFGGGDYNIGLLWSEREDEFVQWCEDHGVKATLV